MKMLIGNEECNASTGETMEIRNPYDHSLVDTVPCASEADVDRAVRYAGKAQKEWRRVPVYQKAEIVKKFLALVEAQKESLARTLCLESGKTITDARTEIRNIFTAWSAFAERAKHLYDRTIPEGREAGHDHNLVMVRREPLGVIACVLPFNFPCNLFNQKTAPALLSGNAAIIKPPSDNPLTVCRLAGLLRDAGVPAGVIQVVTGSGRLVGNALARHPGVAAVSLTGSVPVGRCVAAAGADTLKKVVLELGGNDAFLVLADADLSLAVREAVNTRFYNAGQICCAPKRFLVHRSLYSRFVEEVTREAAALKFGNPLDPETRLGTLINEKAARVVETQVKHAIKQGAGLVLGGVRDGAFYAPTVLADVPREADILHDEEVFGPVLPVTSFETEEEALSLANDSCFGLGASVFTTDMKKAARFVDALECGSVVVNGSSYFRSFEMPFGGRKQSGIGAEGVSSTFEEFTAPKCVVLKGIF